MVWLGRWKSNVSVQTLCCHSVCPQQCRWGMTATVLHKGEHGMKPRASKERVVRPHGLPHLRTLRQRKGLSLGHLSDMTGIRRDTIAHLENVREDPLPYLVRLLPRLLHAPQLALFSYR